MNTSGEWSSTKRRFRPLASMALAVAVVATAFGAFVPQAASQNTTTDCFPGSPGCPTAPAQVLACYRNDGEKLLRVAATEGDCGSHETFIQMSPGAEGPTGPPGPGTEGFLVRRNFGPTVGTTPTTLVSLRLDPGSYSFIAKLDAAPARIINGNGTSWAFTCRVGDFEQSQVRNGGSQVQIPVMVVAAARVAAPFDLDLVCWTPETAKFSTGTTGISLLATKLSGLSKSGS